MKMFFALFVLLALTGCSHSTHHWGYTGEEAPSHWGDISKEYHMCKQGHQQSPINIVKKNAKKTKLVALQSKYKDTPLKVLNNGHTIQVPFEKGSELVLGKVHYNLIQVHFHAHSENIINGKSYPMEAHFVHADAEGHLAVVAVMIKQGKFNKGLEQIFANMPTKVEEKSVTGEMLHVKYLLPKGHKYYHFMGSLTTPPCSENVSWNVLQKPITASKEQLAHFRQLYAANFRPVQELNGRDIERN